MTKLSKVKEIVREEERTHRLLQVAAISMVMDLLEVRIEVEGFIL